MAALCLLAPAAALFAQSTLNDGIPDTWRLQYFGVNFASDPQAVATADPDGDGANNFLEYQMGTSPVNDSSKPLAPVTVSTYAGTVSSTNGVMEGFRTNVTFNTPNFVTLGRDGALYTVEGTADAAGNDLVGGHRIRRIDASGMVTGIVGGAVPGDADGLSTNATLRDPVALVFDREGSAFVLERHGTRIRKVFTNGVVQLFAGQSRTPAFAEGTGTNARFNSPNGMAIDAADNLYVADSSNHRIRKVTPAGVVTTLTGSTSGFSDGTITNARFSTPSDIVCRPDGTLYVADWGNGRIRKIDTNGAVSTLVSGRTYIERVGVDDVGNVYAALPATLFGFYKYDSGGRLLWAMRNPSGYMDGPASQAQFGHISGAAFPADGRIFVTDAGGNAVRLVSTAVPVALVITPGGGLFNNFVTVTISNLLTNVVVRYTVDGTVPTASSAVYSGGIVLENTATVQARAFVSTNPVSDVASAVFTVVPAVCVPAPSGLAAWWAAEGNASDSAGGNNGQTFGAVAYAAGKVGQAFQFNGSNSYVQVPSSTALKTAGAFSVEAWVNYDQLPGNSGVTIATKGVDAEAVQDWALNIYTSGKLRPHLYIGGNWVVFNCATTLAPSTWHHVAMVYDGSTVRGYVNGAQDGSVNVSGTAQTSDNLVRIGAYAPLNGTGTKNFFSGAIDELSIYGRALTALEIAGIYQARGAGKCGLPPTLAITSQPAGQSVIVGGTVSFNVGVSGTPPVAYQWRFNGTNIAGATNSTLTLANVQTTQAGDYSVVVGNVAGSLTSSNAVLTVSAAAVNQAPSFALPPAFPVGGSVVAWGYNNIDQTTVPAGLTGVTAVAAGYYFSVALKNDGTVVAWGRNSLGERNVPAGLNTVTAIAAGAYHGLALKSDGTIVGWGDNDQGQLNMPAGLTGVTAISCGHAHSLALKNDGTVVAWGHNGYGQTNVPAGLNGVAAITAGHYFSLALKSNGTIVAWGNGYNGQTNVPAGLNGIKMIAAGSYHALALMSNGTVAAWGGEYFPAVTNVPGDLNGVTQIACGDVHSLALKSDGTIVAWGSNADGQTNAPPGQYVAVAAGYNFNLAIQGSPTLTMSEDAPVQTVNVTGITPGPASESLQAVSVSAFSSHPAIIPPPLVSYAGGTTGSLSFAPAANANGTVTITVVVSDDGGTANGGVDAATNTFMVTVTPVNDPPTLAVIGDLHPLENPGTQTVILAGITPGPANESNQALTVTAVSGNTGLIPNPTVAYAGGPTGALTFTPTGNVAGSVTISVVVADNGGTANGGVNRVTNSFAVWLTSPAFATNLFDDFDPGIDAPQWSAFGGTVLATNYGGVVSGNNSLWFGGTGSRFATTRALNTAGGGTVGYYLRLASGTNANWEKADLPGEGVVLEYSVDGGTQWTVIATNNTSAFTNWTPQQFQIPAGAQSASTLFRWRQLSNSGAPYDHWALDDISIQTFTNSVAPAIVSGPAGRAAVAGESVSFAVTASGTAPLRYQWRFNGTDMVGATNASLTLNSVQLADAGNYSVEVGNTVGTATSSNAVLTVTAPVCVPAPAGLVAWWAEEGSALDTVGGNNGQAFGSVTYAAGKVGQAFQFNGSNSYVQVPSSAALKTAGPFSVEAWVYYDRIPSNACAIAVKGPDGEVPLDWDFEIHSLRKLRANISINGSWVTLTCATTLATNTWHHVAMVYDGSALRCYLNGVQDGVLGVSGTVQTSDNPVRIGAYAPVNGTGSKNFFSGGIDELSLYSRALSASEVAGIYQARGAGKCSVTPSLAITSQPQDQAVTVGGSASFSVGVSGTPTIAYQWRFNGTNISGATNATLALTNVQFAQAGDYSVVAGNVAGTVTSSNATLTVSAALVRSGPVWLNNYDANSFSGAPIYLLNTSTLAPLDTQVQVLGGPLGGPLSPIISESTHANIIFLSLDGNPGYFDAGYGYAGVPDNSPALIQVLAWRGAASYAAATVRGSALFTNMTGQSSTGTPPSPPMPAILELPSIVMQSTTTAAPAITLQPQGRTVIGGNSAMFGVVAIGSPAVGYQWRFNGADLPGATNANLAILNAQAANAGSYTVFISNTAGSVLSDPAVLTVHYLVETTVGAGGSVWRSPALAVVSNYPSGFRITLFATPDAGFAFTGWGGDATGTNRVLPLYVSTNMSITAGFVENVPPVVTITSPAAGNATGSQTFLAGTASDNVGVVSARWVRDGQPVGSLILSNGTFRVDPLTLARGTNIFRVIAADAAGNEGFAQVTVVHAPPRVLAVVNPAAEQEGREITVPVELTSPGDVAGMTFVLRYDAAYLKEPEVKWSSATASALEQVNISVPGEVRATFALPAITVRAGTEEIARVTFRARSVPTNLTTALTLEVSDVSDDSGNPIAGGVDVEDGSASLRVRNLTGDNNANDRLDTGDATIIQRMLAGLEPVRSWDVTGNDLNATTTLDSGDVIKVMRTVVKLDSPPAPAASAAKSVKPKALAAVTSPVELAVVSPNGLRGLAGELVTVQVLVSNVQAQLAGAEFTLDYPTNALRLVDSTSHQPGSLVSGDTFALWNVLPAQTDFAAQSGRVIAGMSSGTGWPAATNGVLAQFTFRVQAGGAAQYRWPLVLSGVRLTTADGYSERPVGDAQMYFIGRNAIPANLGSGGGTAPRLNGGQFSFGLGGEVGLPYLIEVSENLRDWTPLQTVTNATGTLPFNDPGATNATQRYYRARQLE